MSRLKTPPSTPLFPSLEMDASDPELIIQREIPILQPLSRVCKYNFTFKLKIKSFTSRVDAIYN